MPGRPLLRALDEQIHKLGGEDWFFEQVREGLSMREIAEILDVSRPQLYTWMNLDRENRKAKLREARAESAPNLAEDAGQHLADVAKKRVITSADVALAKEQANHKKWMAGIRNAEFRDSKEGGGGISIGQLHLTVLQNQPPPPTLEAVEEQHLLPAEIDEEE